MHCLQSFVHRSTNCNIKTFQANNDLYRNQCPIVNDMIQFPKETNFASIIEGNRGNQQILFQAMNNLLCRKPLGLLSDC